MCNRLIAYSCKLIWSEILPRRNWIGALDIRSVERKRKRVNRAGRTAAASINGLVVNQPDIEFSEEGLDRADGVHISNVGNAILTNTFQSVIEAFIS